MRFIVYSGLGLCAADRSHAAGRPGTMLEPTRGSKFGAQIKPYKIGFFFFFGGGGGP